jgi:hypothetical protein
MDFPKTPIIVIIDSGVSIADASLNGCRIRDIKGDFVIEGNYSDELGHGTAMFGIIRRHCPTAEYYIVKISDGDEKPHIRSLIYALEYINTNINCNIINLSLTISFAEYHNYIIPLRNICDHIRKKGVIIIAAFDNGGSISYPAAFSNVIGVISGEFCYKTMDIEVVDDGNEFVNLAGFGRSQSVLNTSGTYSIGAGNSAACAHITGIIADRFSLIEDANDIASIIKVLNNLCVMFHKYPRNITQIVNARLSGKTAMAIMGKEMFSLFRYSDMLTFEIASVFDTCYSGFVGQRISNIPNQQLNSDFIIQDIKNADLEGYVNVVIGHISPFVISKRVMGAIHNFVKMCINLDLHIFSLDELSDYFIDIPSQSYFSPQMNWEKKSITPFGKLHRIDVPVVGIFGTSSRQGKFTLQIELRKRFLNDGYLLKQIGTEPTSPLFGIDACYHFGFNSKMQISHFDMVTYINYLQHNLLQADTDVLLIGCQSATVPNNFGNINDISLHQMEFLIAVQPDIVFLCVNFSDNFKYIERTIMAIESLADTKVIGLAFLPIKQEIQINNQITNKQISDEEITNFKDDLSSRFNIPAFAISSEADLVYETVINALS